jgi:sulfite reductase beta subunit-like hemoprotein
MSGAARRFDRSAPLEDLHSNERLKHGSRYLRGTLEASLADQVTGAVDENDALLTKFFGIYQQDDRDLRDERRRAKLEPRYQFMVRVRLPGGVCTPAQWLAPSASRVSTPTVRCGSRRARRSSFTASASATCASTCRGSRPPGSTRSRPAATTTAT